MTKSCPATAFSERAHTHAPTNRDFEQCYEYHRYPPMYATKLSTRNGKVSAAEARGAGWAILYALIGNSKRYKEENL